MRLAWEYLFLTTMVMQQAFQFELRPNWDQERQFRESASVCRLVFNSALAPAGTVDEPGKNVAAKAGLNRAILQQGWGEFRRQLAYKLEWVGGTLISVPAQYASQNCPAPGCGYIAPEGGNRRTQSKFACLRCGFAEHADLVGAKNVLDAAAGHGAVLVGASTRQRCLWRVRRSEAARRSRNPPK